MSDTILFDMDGVVIDSEMLYDLQAIEFLSRKGVDSERIKRHRELLKPQLAGKDALAASRIIKEFYGFPDAPEELVKERLSILKEMYWQHLKFIPGFEDFIEAVKKLGFKHCISTASPMELLDIVEQKLHVSEIFSGNVFKISEVGNAGKKQLFLYSAGRLGSQAQNCAVIEDAPIGVKEARHAGMYSIGITTTFGAEKLASAHLVVKEFREIDLEKLASASVPITEGL